MTIRGITAALIVMAAAPAVAQRGHVVARIHGDPVYKVLEPGAIPAIDDPAVVTGREAEEQMSANEPVIGVVVGDTARAYSTWQLDAHEIVNDEVEGRAIAATW